MELTIFPSSADVPFGRNGRLGAIIPANNSVLEPEWWSALPTGAALYATRILARGDLTPDAVRKMEENVDGAVDELAATGVDVIAYCDMVTTFIMEPGWNEAKTADIERRSGTAAVSAWTAMRDALEALGIRRFALGTPYPAAIHALAPPFFTACGYDVVSDHTLDILKMRDVPNVTPQRIRDFVAGFDRTGAQAIVLLATDLPCFSVIAALEQEFGLPVLTSNQTILWSSLRAANKARKRSATIPALGKLFSV
ncbi:MAG: decarboxylase [Tardiphaga sp.]|nr:decarboxylase [Tardiphaga sp.]